MAPVLVLADTGLLPSSVPRGTAWLSISFNADYNREVPVLSFPVFVSASAERGNQPE